MALRHVFFIGEMTVKIIRSPYLKAMLWGALLHTFGKIVNPQRLAHWHALTLKAAYICGYMSEGHNINLKGIRFASAYYMLGRAHAHRCLRPFERQVHFSVPHNLNLTAVEKPLKAKETVPTPEEFRTLTWKARAKDLEKQLAKHKSLTAPAVVAVVAPATSASVTASPEIPAVATPSPSHPIFQETKTNFDYSNMPPAPTVILDPDFYAIPDDTEEPMVDFNDVVPAVSHKQNPSATPAAAPVTRDDTAKKPPVTTMPFGKHQGSPIAKVPTRYLQWVLANLDTDEPLRAGIIRSLEKRGINSADIVLKAPGSQTRSRPPHRAA
jgi:hypothetical protein